MLERFVSLAERLGNVAPALSHLTLSLAVLYLVYLIGKLVS
ncbi:Uncharacterised protein [Yersinia thracica]|uniref:Uncharacterized protein n=1 Tax=Yersinia thracica TaxID=2890319 RepID=A0A0T9QZR8_9GAMM|nr:Uncharacterised protein [Yersinia thracica]